jgi:hypothetical protein
MALPTNATIQVDCTITQANGTNGHNTTYTWAGYRFGVSDPLAAWFGRLPARLLDAESTRACDMQRFSDWVQMFDVGTGQIIITDTKTKQILVSVSRPLTPGPLVVALVASPGSASPQKYWPPVAGSIETIAASYPPPKAGSANVRLVNLSPRNLAFGGEPAGFKVGGRTLAQNVGYAGSSAWMPVEPKSQTFEVMDKPRINCIALL